MSSRPPPEAGKAVRPLKINRWWRVLVVALGLAGLGSGGTAVFITQLEAGPVALLAVGLVLLLVGVGGRLPNRLKVGENEAAWESVEGFIARVTDDVPSEQTSKLVEALNQLAVAAPSAAAVGLGAVTERVTYERMVAEMLSEAVRQLNRSEGAEQLGGLSLTLEHKTEFGVRVDAAITTGRGDYIAIEIKYSYGRVSLPEMIYLPHKARRASPESHVIGILFVSNQGSVSEFDISYLQRTDLSVRFEYLQVASEKDLPKLAWAIRTLFQIHG